MRAETLAGLAAAAEVIDGARSIVTTGHIGPDGDSLGSALGFALAARASGRQAVVAFSKDFEVPQQFAFLDTSPVVEPDAVGKPDVLVTFDVGDLHRIGEMAAVAERERAKKVVMIDHHLSTRGFGDLIVNDPEAAAAAQLSYELITRLGWELPPAAAMALHVGLVTDTGRFQYSNTSPDALQVAARLVAAGAAPEVIGQSVYESVPFGYLGLAGAVLSRARLEEDRNFIWSSVSLADLEAHGLGWDETDPLIDAVRVAREADVAALAKEAEDGVWKISLRSRGRVDVSAIATAKGGGGHHNASGFTFTGSLDDAIAEVRNRLP